MADKIYPRRNGKELTDEQRVKFDEWEERFIGTIGMTNPDLLLRDVKILAKNCAFDVIIATMIDEDEGNAS